MTTCGPGCCAAGAGIMIGLAVIIGGSPGFASGVAALVKIGLPAPGSAGLAGDA